MKKHLFLLMAFTAMFAVARAQKNVILNIRHKLGAADLAFNTTAQNDLGQSFQISRIDYYISGISIIHDGGMIIPVTGKYILTKGNNVAEFLGTFDVTNVEGISFSIGVDSPMNNADPAMQSGPLELQSPSMHWGWAAGYRFVVLEGKAGNDLNTNFELHGLWNKNYFQQTVMAAGIANGNNINIDLTADYTQALKGIDVASGPLQHGVDGQDLVMLKNFQHYVFKPAAGTTAINDIAAGRHIRIYPNPAKGKIYIDLSGSGTASISGYKITDMGGKTIETGKVAGGNAITLRSHIRGSYILMLYSKDVPVCTQMIVLE